MMETFWFLRFQFRRVYDAACDSDFWFLQEALLRLEPDSDADNQPLRHICQQNLNFEAVSVGSVGEKSLFSVGAYNFPLRNNHTKIIRGDYRFKVHKKLINIARRWNVSPLFFISHWLLTRKPLIVLSDDKSSLMRSFTSHP